jgi:uncharacterized membrane protein YkoI
MNVKMTLLGAVAALVLVLGAGVAYAHSSADDDEEESYKGSVSAPDQSGAASLQESAKIDQAAAEQAALEAVPGTVHELELETSDNGYVVYDVEVAGEDGKNHEVKVDAGNGEILHRDLEDESDEFDGGEADDSD